MPRAGDVVAGKYRIESVIGEGGMGAVFAATHMLTGKRVALKWMLPELASDEAAVQRFVREAQAAGRIDHTNIVDIYDVGEHEGSTFLVMEYLHGDTLAKAVESGSLDARQVIQLLLPAMRGVAAAHKTGVIHRDLKPDNIFLCRESDGAYLEPKVLDFGISKVQSSGTEGQASNNMRLTRTGAVMGTPYYMSPEQIRGSSEVDQRTDVYAFGVILYEALTGRVPFDADAYSALILEIATGTPKRPRELRPELPEALDRVVMKAMAREPGDRYQSVDALARALEPFADGVTFRVDRAEPTGSQQSRQQFGTATTPFAAEGPVSLPVHHGGRRAALAGVVLLVGALALMMYRQRVPAADADADTPVVAPMPAAAHAGIDPSPEPLAAASKQPATAADAGAAAEAPANAAPPARAATPAVPGPKARAGMPESERAAHHGHRTPEADSRRPSATTPRPAPSGTGRSGALNANEF
jgi:tRNA A-37 threonylcarbamoyl transferase component Bud32